MTDWQTRLIELKGQNNKWESIAQTLNAEYGTDFTWQSVRGWYRRHHKKSITPKAIMDLSRMDSTKWELKSYRQKLGDSSILVKPIEKGLSLEEIDKHFELLDRYYTPMLILPEKQNGSLIAEVNIADLHMGRLCWRGDTGGNFDFKIARNIYEHIISDIYHELKHYDLEYIAFPVGNDLVNSDTPNKTTTAGTPQDTDLRWQKLIDVVTEMMITGIDALKEIAPLKAFYVASNHDKVTTYGIVNAIQCWYRNDPRVQVDKSPIARKYMDHGCTLVGYSHGSEEKPMNGTKYTPSRLAALMPIEAREQWGKAKFYEIHAAHLHTEKAVDEINGVLFRRVSSPTAPDTWTFESGFIGNVRKAQTFLYDKQRGMNHIINTTAI